MPEIQMAGDRLRLVWEAAAVLLTANDPDAMLRELFARIGSALGVDVYLNYLVNETGDALQLASYEGITAETARTIDRLELGQAICGTVALQRQPILASQIQLSDDPKIQLVKSLGIRAYACHPLIAANRLLGTLSFASRTRDQFDADDAAFLETICHYVTIAYDRLRLVNGLKEAQRQKDEFLAAVVHELRNLLEPVRNAVSVLGLDPPDESELRCGRGVIERHVDRLTRLIEDLMDTSRITLKKLELRRQRVELAGIVNNAVESSRPLIERNGHELAVTLPTRPVYINGDSVRLTQAFTNLLNNAAKYTEHAGRIWLTAERQGGEVVVQVKDTGVGIPPERLPHIFEMFYQADRSFDRSKGGLGIGLSLVRGVVELHGGRVDVRSAGVGKGSEFTVRLPVLVEEPKPPSHGQPDHNRGAEPAIARRILVVDDNRISADSLAKLLQLMGNQVYSAYDGLSGVEAAVRFRPDVVLLDIAMPKMNGYDACRHIRSGEGGKEIVLIAVTGWHDDETRRRTEEAGFDAYSLKPVDPGALLKLLCDIEARRRGPCMPPEKPGPAGAGQAILDNL